MFQGGGRQDAGGSSNRERIRHMGARSRGILSLAALAALWTLADNERSPPPAAPNLTAGAEPLAKGQDRISAPRAYRTLSPSHGYVGATTLSIRSAPTHSAPVIARYLRGTLVTLIDERGEWVRVVGPMGLSGWVPAGHLMIPSAAVPRERAEQPLTEGADAPFAHPRPPGSPP
jgi:hypothetical protein